MNESMIDLKPCPFCGGEAELYAIKPYRKHSPLKGKYRARCSRESCLARSLRAAYNTETDAAEAWNWRA